MNDRRERFLSAHKTCSEMLPEVIVFLSKLPYVRRPIFAYSIFLAFRYVKRQITHPSSHKCIAIHTLVALLTFLR